MPERFRDIFQSLYVQPSEQAFRQSLMEPICDDEVLLSLDAIGYMITPPRLYELGARPEDVKLLFWNNPSRGPRATLIWYRPIPLIGKYSDRLKRRTEILNIDGEWVQNTGIIIHDFRISEELRFRGLGTSFYKHFRECAKLLGFRYMYGMQAGDEISFFMEKLGRIKVTQLNPEFWHELAGDNAIHSRRYTVDFFRPEDREAGLNPCPEEEAIARWNKYFFHR